MGYKRIPSALRNLAHSFVSLMNYVDDEYIVDILPSVLSDLPEHELVIRFPDGTLEPDRTYPSRLRKSVRLYAARFAGHFEGEGVVPESVAEAQLTISRGRLGLQCEARAVDDRGKTYAVTVRPA